MSPPGQELPTSNGFCKIIEKVYKLPNADPNHPVVTYTLDLIYRAPSLRLICSAGRILPFLLDASRKVPEFGGDLFLEMLKHIGTTRNDQTEGYILSQMEFTTFVQCPECRRGWIKSAFVLHEVMPGHCLMCGCYVNDWRKHRAVYLEDTTETLRN
jgi:hypothetical protein